MKVKNIIDIQASARALQPLLASTVSRRVNSSSAVKKLS